MSKAYANIQPGFDTFASWLTKTNGLLDDMTNIVITVASNSTGGVTTGNAYIDGTLSGTTGAFNTLRGGNVGTNAVLTIASNVAVSNGYTLFFGNTSVNTSVNATSFSGISNTALALNTARNIALSTDATGNANFDGSANITIAVTLANSGVTANTYGNSTVYPVITVDAKGRVTAVTAQTVSTPATGVTSFNTRTGAVTLTAADITGNSSVGLNYTPLSANTSGSISGSLTLTSSGDLTTRDVLASRDIVAGNSTVNTTVNSTSIYTSGIVATGSNTLPSITLNNIAENINATATAANGTINLDVINQSAVWYTANATNNWTINVRGNSTTTLNSFMGNNKVITVVFLANQSDTPYYANAFTIDGSSVTPKWLSFSPTTGNANGVDSYTYTIVKTANATYSVLASQVQFV